MNNLELLYDIPLIKVDKSKPIYDPDKNIIYFRPTNNFFAKYYLEATNKNKEGIINRYIIFSANKIHPQCRRCNYDNFGRIKIHTYAFRTYLQSQFIHKANITIDIADVGDDYIGVKLNI